MAKSVEKYRRNDSNIEKILLGMARASACHRPVNVKEPTFMTRCVSQPKHESQRVKTIHFWTKVGDVAQLVPKAG
jgi:hypothetical protein